jgi:RNA polymerase sigma factor (sigma-70 family)
MPTNPRPTSSRSLVTLFDAGTLGARTDRELLECFQSDRTAAGQEAFRVLVERHGPMVLGLCHSLVRDPHEAEDAFQATFLILVSKAGTIERKDTIAPWLYGVAARVSRRALHRSLARRRREVPTSDEIPSRESRSTVPQPFDNLVQEEIARLPESIRAPILLCCLEGLSYDLAARRLGVKEPTLRGRLHRARKRLASRLQARGVTIPQSDRPDHRFDIVMPPVPLPLLESTVQFSIRWPSVSGLVGHASGIPGSVTTLVQGVVSSMLFHTVKVSAAVALLSAGVLGTVVLAQQGRQNGSATSESPELAQQEKAAFRTVKDRTEPRTEMVQNADKTRRIQEKLDQAIAAEFPDGTTLGNLLKHIKQATTDDKFSGIPIYVDPAGLLEAHQTILMPIVINVSRRPAGLILSDALGGSGLSYCVDNGFLMISSRSAILEKRVDQIGHKLDLVLDALRRLEAAK